MKDAVLYIHGKGGNAAECKHYLSLFPGCEVFGLDYQTFTPWETGPEIRAAAEKLKDECANIILIANSIGAYFSMSAGIGGMIREAYFVSPIVDYLECMDDYLNNKTEYGWYLCMDKEQIVGGLGVIENDFHDRMRRNARQTGRP